MAYIPKAGSFTLFTNDYKTQDNHPNYRGDGLDLEGNPIEVSAWVKQGAKGEFISCSFKPKVAKPVTNQISKPVPKGISTSERFEDSDIPFN